jgi:HTH-type transcriptional regulator/antitoxin HigA
LSEIATLMLAGPDTPEGDRLDVLATLVEAWEARHVPIEAPDPIAAVLFMMEQKGLERRDLEPAIGSRARVAEVLNRKRALTLRMIRALSRLLDLPADVLVQAYPVKRAA